MRTGISWLDLKLGARMLVKHPGLTLVGGLGMTLAIAIGAGFFELTEELDAPLPFEEGERIIAIESWDRGINNQERRILGDFAVWRDELETVRDLGAWRQVGRSLIVGEGSSAPVTVAEMTASGFRLARVPPLLGRTLVEADHREGAPPVLVIGRDVWRNRFAGDPDVIGRTVRLGETEHTIVGVMPEGFGFPVNNSLWVPLRAEPSDRDRRAGPAVFVFGRLAPGATIERARTELATLGRRMAASFPDTHARLRPRIMPYTLQFIDDAQGREFKAGKLGGQLVVVLLLLVICVNVAILTYARTARRRGEIAVRTALGASRMRVVAQLFAEALVLSLAAAAVGLAVAGAVLAQLGRLTERVTFIPFWMEFDLSAGTVLYVGGLAVLAAVIVGVLPALKATGRRLRSGLRELAGGATLKMGRTWTVLIVAQVAIAVAVLPAAVYFTWETSRYGFADPGFPAEDYLAARLSMDRPDADDGEGEAARRGFRDRYARRVDELVLRLEEEPGVAGVTFALRQPDGEPTVWIEAEGVPMPEEPPSGFAVREGTRGHEVRINKVGIGFFDAFDVPVRAGRSFRPGDVGAAAGPVIVNESFVRRVLDGRNALGRGVRYVGRSGDVGSDDVDLGRWYEIVGVVPDFPDPLQPGLTSAKLYHPASPAAVYPARLAIRTRGRSPAAFAPRLREMSIALDPMLQPREVLSLAEVLDVEQRALRLTALGIVLVTLSVLLFSAAGIHALMAFAVALRRREIGIRAALGPARRGLRIQPTEALKADG